MNVRQILVNLMHTQAPSGYNPASLSDLALRRAELLGVRSLIQLPRVNRELRRRLRKLHYQDAVRLLGSIAQFVVEFPEVAKARGWSVDEIRGFHAQLELLGGLRRGAASCASTCEDARLLNAEQAASHNDTVDVVIGEMLSEAGTGEELRARLESLRERVSITSEGYSTARRDLRARAQRLRADKEAELAAATARAESLSALTKTMESIH